MMGLQPLPIDPFQRLVISVFRLNGALIAAGDDLVADLGLTSARWQVLGAAATAPVPLTIASIARNMGLTRQTVRTTVKDLHAAGLVQLAVNPHHQRAQLVVLTTAGERAYATATERQEVWAKGIGHGVSSGSMVEAAGVLQTMLSRLLDGRSDDEPA